MSPTLKILILEDNPDDAEIIQRLLIKEKIKAEFSVTMTAGGFVEALEQFKPDVILSDNSMPQFNATEALDIINQRALHIPFILVTGTVSEEFAANIIKQGADDYILKDRLARLPAAINAALSLHKAEKEKKDAEEKIIQSETNLRAIFENTSEGFLLIDLEGRVKAFNQKATTYSFFSKESSFEIGKPVYNFITEPRIDAFKEIFSKVIQGESIQYEQKYEREDGDTNWLYFSLIPVTEAGKVTGVCITGRDITQQKKAEEKLKKNFLEKISLAQRMSTILNTLPANIALLDEQGIIADVNKAWRNFADNNGFIGANYAIGDNYLDIALAAKGIENQDGIAAANGIKNVLKKLSNEFTMDYPCHSPGEERWFRMIVTPLKEQKEAGAVVMHINITKQKKDEEKIQKSEEQYRDLVENISDLICTHDLDGRILSVNKAAEELIGQKFNPEENLNIKDLLAPGKKDMFSPYITELKTNGRAQGLMEVQTFKGKIHIWEYNNSLKTTGGETIVRGYARDITETKKAADKIRFDAELLNTVGQAVIATDINGIVIYWNNAAEKIYGWAAAETIGRNIVDLTPAEQSKEMAVEIMKELKQGNSWSGEFLVNRKDGTVFPAHVTDSPIHDNQGQVIGIIGVSMDISERKKAEKEITDYKYALDQSSIISMTEQKGTIIYVNENFCSISQYSADELLGSDHSIVNSGYHSEEFIKNLWQTIEGGKIWKGELRNKAKDGSIYWVDATIVPFLDARGKPYQYLAIRYDITQKKKTEEQLKISEEKYRTIFIKSPLPVWIYDIETLQILDANEAAILHYGYTKEEFLSITIKNIRPKEDLEELLKDIDKINKGMESRQGTWRHQKKNGEIIIVETMAHPIEYSNRKARLVIANDITERIKAEEKLSRSEENYRTIMERLTDGFVAIDKNWQYTYVNKAAGKILNRNPGELTGKNIWNEFPEGIDQTFHKAYHKAMEEQKYLYLEEYYPPFDMWLENHIYPSPDGLSIFFTDITQKKKAEQEILQTQMRLKQAQEISHLGNWEFNFKTNTAKYSDEAYRIYGLSPGDDLNMDIWLTFVHPDEMEDVKQKIEKAQNELSDLSMTLRIVRKDGAVRYVYSETKYEIDNENNLTGMYGIIHDITERKKAEEKILKYAEELKDSNTELERFAYVASHDLQEPLRMVTSFLNLLEDDMSGSLTDASKEYMHYVVDGAARMKILINDLLQYSRVGANKEEFTAVDPNELMKYVNFLLKEDIEKTHATVTIHKLPVITANKTLINQLFMNLMSNALKYHDGKNPVIEVGCTEKPGSYIFYVKDNGIGIDAESLEKIFVIFQRLHSKNEYSGTGIGLAISKKIVEIHKGKIWVESEKEKGSTFYFSIPKK